MNIAFQNPLSVEELPRTRHVIADNALVLDGKPLIQGLSNTGWRLDEKDAANGVFIHWTPAVGFERSCSCYHETTLGRICDLRRFTSCHRFVPFWLRPVVGRTENEIKSETLWVLAELEQVSETPRYLLIVPLLSSVTRHALRGSASGLVLTSETGDPATPCVASDAVFVATGDDPYRLLEESARAVSRRLGTGRLRREKTPPAFIDDFGWCTWDAFYKEVSPEGVIAGLDAFAAGGVSPRMVILDDGWQSVRRAASGEEYLSDFAPNARFGGDLGPLVDEAKQRLGVRHFLVWHAMLGYWGGADPEVWAKDYGVRTTPRLFGPGVLREDPTWNIGPWGAQAGVPAAARLEAFYDAYHSRLAAQGVDGVKVDAQAMVEAFGWGQGGRIPLARAARHGLERSARRHFAGGLINCMGATQESAYLSADSTLLRTSDDYWPTRPETHGAHLHTNAQVSLWLGEFMQPDWDMFQSAHEWAGFHAAARSLSGGPVYVSDKVGEHDFPLLRKLVLSDGSVLRADMPARPSPDSIFSDPTREAVPLKIFNMNRDCGVVGVFNARHTTDKTGPSCLTCEVSPRDVPPLAGAAFIGYAHRRHTLWPATNDTRTAFELAEGEWEIISFAPVEHGFAVLGLADKFNSTGAITSREWHGIQEVHVRLRDGGRFLFWSERAPSAVLFRGLAFSPSRRNDPIYEYALPAEGPIELVVRWASPFRADSPKNFKVR